MAFAVHLDVYDGPFNLLLQLISVEEVDVYQVSLSKIVDAFLAELKKLEQLDLELATEFLLIAATLVELKCRRLLPGNDDLEIDDDLSLFEARDYLLARLVECKTFSEAANELAGLESMAARSAARRSGPDERFDSVAPDLLAKISPQILCEVARRVLADRPIPVVATGHIHEDEITVAETLDLLVGILPSKGRATLRELCLGDLSKVRFVATFLAVLELYKREMVEFEQAENFSELVIIWTAELRDHLLVDVDNYDDSAALGAR